MTRGLFLTAILLVVVPACGGTAQAQSVFQTAAGVWYGALEYSDYRTEKRVKLPTLLTIEPSADGNAATFTYLFDDFGRVLKSTEVHRIDRAPKKYFVDDAVFSFEETDGKLVLLGRASDNDRDEPVRETISFGADVLSVLKEKRSPFQFRHRYDFQRSREYVGSEGVLSPSKMVEDLAILKTVLETLHPGVYRYANVQQLEARFASLAELTAVPLSEGQFLKLIAQTVSFIKCGHTYLNPLNQSAAVRERLFGRRNYLPFYFRLLDRRMIVTGNVSTKTLPRGSEIVKINDIPVARIIDSLLLVTTADGENTQAHRLNSLEVGIVQENREQPFDLYFPLFFPLKEPIFTVEAIDYRTKQTVKFQVLALTKTERRARTEELYGRTPTYDDGWNFAIGNDGIAHLRIGNFITWRLKNTDPKRFLADAFARMRAAGVKILIIDLRGNGGGDTDTGFELARYLAQKPLPPYLQSKRLVRNVLAQAELAAHLKTYSAELKAELTNGTDPHRFRKRQRGYFEILTRPELESYPAVTSYPNSFRGQVYLISDSSNASAAFQFVDYVRTHRLATIVGQETGGNRQGINGGNFFFLTLPNSGVEIDIPVYFTAPLRPAPDSGVVPDRLVRPTIDDLAAGNDVELAYVKELIKTRGSKPSVKH